MNQTRDAEEIQRHMARIRCDLNAEVGEMVHSAQAMSRWQYYVGNYPWICVGAAVALGYWIVPARVEVIRPDPEALAKLAQEQRLLVRTEAEPRPRGGWLASLATVAATMLARNLASYAGQRLGQLVADQAGRPRRPVQA